MWRRRVGEKEEKREEGEEGECERGQDEKA